MAIGKLLRGCQRRGYRRVTGSKVARQRFMYRFQIRFEFRLIMRDQRKTCIE